MFVKCSHNRKVHVNAKGCDFERNKFCVSSALWFVQVTYIFPIILKKNHFYFLKCHKFIHIICSDFPLKTSQ